LHDEQAKTDSDMEPKEDAIVDIPGERLRFFDGAGKMLLPGPATVAALIEKVPAGRLITTNLVCRILAQQFNVRGTCPVTTGKALQAVAHDPTSKIAYWRVVKADGGLISRFPGGAEGQAERLRREGFRLDRKGKAPKVTNFRNSLIPL
jgi:alkylated DNA nucleotide flippase Atl1